MCLEVVSRRILLHDHLGQCDQAAAPPCSLLVALLEHGHDICPLPVITFPSYRDLSKLIESSLVMVLTGFISPLGCILCCLMTWCMQSLLHWALTLTFFTVILCCPTLCYWLQGAGRPLSRAWEWSEAKKASTALIFSMSLVLDHLPHWEQWDHICLILLLPIYL